MSALHPPEDRELIKTSPSLEAPAVRRRRGPATAAVSLTKVTAVLGDGHSVTVSGPDLDLPRVIALLGESLAKARKAHAQQMSLATYVSLLRDQAERRVRGPSAD